LDTESLAEFLFDGGIDLGEGEWWIVFGKDLGGGAEFWSKLLAVTTPRSVKLNKKEVMVFKFFIKVFVGEYEDSLFLCDFFGKY